MTVTLEVAAADRAPSTMAIGMIQNIRNAVVTRSRLSGYSTSSRAAYAGAGAVMAATFFPTGIQDFADAPRARAIRGRMSRYAMTAIPTIMNKRFGSTAGSHLTLPPWTTYAPAGLPVIPNPPGPSRRDRSPRPHHRGPRPPESRRGRPFRMAPRKPA